MLRKNKSYHYWRWRRFLGTFCIIRNGTGASGSQHHQSPEVIPGGHYKGVESLKNHPIEALYLSTKWVTLTQQKMLEKACEIITKLWIHIENNKQAKYPIQRPTPSSVCSAYNPWFWIFPSRKKSQTREIQLPSIWIGQPKSLFKL